MKTILTSLLLLLSTALFAQQEPPEKSFDEWMMQLDEDPKKGRKELEKAIKKYPNNPWVYYMMGLSMNPVLEENDDIPYFEKAVALDSTFGEVHFQLAQALSLGDSVQVERVIDHFTKAIQYSEDPTTALAFRGRFYFEQKNYDQAIADSKKAKVVMIYPDYDLWLANKTIIESLNAQLKMAELKSFLALNDPNMGGGPDDPDYQYLLGTIYESFGQTENACASYKQALSEQEFYDELFADTEEDERPPHPEWLSIAEEKVKKCK